MKENEESVFGLSRSGAATTFDKKEPFKNANDSSSSEHSMEMFSPKERNLEPGRDSDDKQLQRDGEEISYPDGLRLFLLALVITSSMSTSRAC